MFFIRISLFLRFLIMLKLIDATSALIFPKPSDGSKKSVICVVKNGVKNIQQLPPQCTSLASYTSNTKTGPDDIQALRKDGDLQYLLIIDNYKYDTIKDYVTTDSITEFINKISDSITQFSANGVLFTRMNSDKPEIAGYGEPNGTFQQGVKQLFTELREKHNDIVFELCLTSVEEYLDHAWTQDFISSVVDFFVADTVLINYCAYDEEQSKMFNISPLKDIKEIMDMMLKKKFSSDKLIFIIRVVVMSTKSMKAVSKEDTSYSDGLLVKNLKLKGVVVQLIDYDDYIPNCGPEKFPVMQAIEAGIDGIPEPKKVTGEPNWATLARNQV